MKRVILSAAVVLGVGLSWGQQEPQYSNFMYDKLSVNPGSAGIHGMYCGTVLYRNQWMGFDGAPKTILLNLDAGVPLIHGGVGVTFFNDQLGFETNNIIRVAYSWHQPIPGGLLGIGLAGGYASKSFNANWNPIDPTDTFIPGNTDSQGALDITFGLYFKNATDNWYVGLSGTHLNGAGLDQLNLDVSRHYWVMAGYKYPQPLANGHLTLAADFMTKTDFAATQFDIAARAFWDNMIYAGVSYRHQDAIFPMIGYQTELTPSAESGGCSKMYLTAGVSYDVTLSDLKHYSDGALELFVKFCFKPCIRTVLPKPYDVRFLGT